MKISAVFSWWPWLQAHVHRQDPGENGRRIEHFIGENEQLSQINGKRPVYCQNLIIGGLRGKVTSRYSFETTRLVCLDGAPSRPYTISAHLLFRLRYKSLCLQVIPAPSCICPWPRLDAFRLRNTSPGRVSRDPHFIWFICKTGPGAATWHWNIVRQSWFSFPYLFSLDFHKDFMANCGWLRDKVKIALRCGATRWLPGCAEKYSRP
jgi:hypothetical protein